MTNPYAKGAQNDVNNNVNNMGRQSQQRVSNQHKRKFKLAQASSSRRRKGDQLTLDNRVAFQLERDCKICKAKILQKFTPSYPIPKRAHNVLCPLNTKTRGLGELSEQSVASLHNNKRYKALTAPILPSERHSGKHATKAAGEAFFATRLQPKTMTPELTKSDSSASALTFSKTVGELANNADFREKHKAKGSPLAMLAFATEVSEKVIREKNVFFEYFQGVQMDVPAEACHNNPHCHSIIGQKLLHIDWERTHGIQVPCPDSSCTGTLRSDRSNFSKNKTLFPTYGLDGTPTWCIVMVLLCPCCRRRFNSNEADVLVNIPDYAATCYPVDTTCAQRDAKCHLNRNATDAFSSIMVTYGNGELCSKLLFNAVNRDYIRRIKAHHSMAKDKGTVTATYIEKDGEFMRQYPPLGDTIRDMCDASCSSQKNPWCVSDHDRHILEIQSVKCSTIFAQDHTFQVTKNYQKKVGAIAAWDVATDTGEIATAVLVRNTKTESFAHAAQQLMRRPGFKPKSKCSDTWPNKKECWHHVAPGVEGRLGLFHYQKRIIGTLKKNHIDYFDSVTDLLGSIYQHCSDDYDRLLAALKNGTLSRHGRKYTSEETSDMKRTRVFRDRYGKCLRKKLHKESTIIQMLDDWFCRHKVTSSDPSRPGQGRLDPTRLETLFTPDTKIAVENCKDKAKYLSDALPLEDMYETITPNPNSSHQLPEYLSKRGESKLEAFHDRFAHFANCGMRASLADNLNLAGTARCNLAIRHKRSMVMDKNTLNEKPMSMLSDPEVRKKIPAGWDQVVPHFNHSELWYINKMAEAVNCPHPFPHAEVLPADNGERFFSEHLSDTMPSLKGNLQHGEWGQCLCNLCSVPTTNSDPLAKTVVTYHDDEATSTATTRAPAQTTPVPTIINATNNVNSDCRTRQQASQPAPCTAPATITPTNANYTGVVHGTAGAFIPIAPLIPMQWQLPFYCNNTMMTTDFFAPCCDKHANWLTARVGRPPHHPLCAKRW